MFDEDGTPPPDDPGRDSRLTRLVLLSLAGVVGVGVVVGLLLSWVGTSVLDAAGINGGDDGQSQRPAMNDPVTTTPPTPTPDDPTTTEPTEPSTTTTTTKPADGAGSLVATPESAATFERVTLSGRLPGVPAGTSLQVQRLEGGSWVPFPTSATAQAAGSFSTFVELGQPGPNRMRVIVPGSTRSSPTVTITIT